MTLAELVWAQIGAEYDEGHVLDAFDRLSNADLLERISDALEKLLEERKP